MYSELWYYKYEKKICKKERHQIAESRLAARGYGPTDRWTARWIDRRTDRPSYRDARTHLKRGTDFKLSIRVFHHCQQKEEEKNKEEDWKEDDDDDDDDDKGKEEA